MAPVGGGVGDGVGEVLLDESAIRAEVGRLALQISADYADKSLHLVGVLKGATIFIADLLRALTVPATLDFISIVPYGQVTSSGVVRIRKDLDEPLEGKDVLVVEGICASGLSLSYLLRNFQTRRPASLRTCAFVVKRRERPADVTLHYFGREVPDVFVVGYGLDAQEQYRNLHTSPASPDRPLKKAHLLRWRPRPHARGSSSRGAKPRGEG